MITSVVQLVLNIKLKEQKAIYEKNRIEQTNKNNYKFIFTNDIEKLNSLILKSVQNIVLIRNSY